MEIPFLEVPLWHHGTTEHGSSGSGFFNESNKLIGQEKGGPFSACENGIIDYYGKFRSNYFNFVIRSSLNPDYDLGVDLVGLEGRKITCYDNLDLPGAPGVSGHYFPASHYQPENTIWLRSRNNITTNAPIHVYDGADYRFQAAGYIDISSDFDAEQGSYVEMQIGNCAEGKEPSPTGFLAQKLKENNLPKEKKLDMRHFGNGQLYASQGKQGYYMQLFPNPTTGAFTLRFSQAGSYHVSVKDLLGRQVAAYEGKNVSELPIRLETPAGQYYIAVSDERHQVQYGRVTVVQ